MAIAPIGALLPISPPPPPTAPSSSVGAATPAFGTTLSNAVDTLQKTQATAAADEAQMAAGQGNLADTMIAASEASLQTQVSSDLLNKAVASYNEILNMTL